MSRSMVVAAGGVLWRGNPTRPEVALVHRPHYDDWSVPKGKTKAGEHLLVTALREMTEETGHVVRVGPRLTTVRYPVTSGGRAATKVVTYWSMRCAGGSFQPNREVDQLEWLPVEAAHRRVTSATDRVVLDTFVHTRRDTESLLLVRPGPTTLPARRPKADPATRKLNRSGRDHRAPASPEGLAHTAVPPRCGHARPHRCSDRSHRATRVEPHPGRVPGQRATDRRSTADGRHLQRDTRGVRPATGHLGSPRGPRSAVRGQTSSRADSQEGRLVALASSRRRDQLVRAT